MVLRRRAPATLVVLVMAVAATGCIGGVGEDGALLGASGGDALETMETPYEEAGSLDTGVGVCTIAGEVAINACGSGVEMPKATPDGAVQEASFTLTWDAETPLMEELGMSIAWSCGGQGGCEVAWDSGESPLEVTVDDLDEEGSLHVFVWRGWEGAEQASLDVKHTQSFEVTGTLTSLVPGNA